MNVSRYHRTISALIALIALTLTIAALFARPAFAIPASTRDGHNDCGFLVGSWHTEYRRLRHVLQHNHEWYTCLGHSRDENFWDGSGNIEVGDLRCPGQHIEGMVLRTYSSATRDWTLYWGTKRLGALNPPPQVGHFTAAATGDFFSKDTYAGKPIVVRYRWRLLAGDHPYFEQAFSPDGGKTWETNWTTVYTRSS